MAHRPPFNFAHWIHWTVLCLLSLPLWAAEPNTRGSGRSANTDFETEFWTRYDALWEKYQTALRSGSDAEAADMVRQIQTLKMKRKIYEELAGLGIAPDSEGAPSEGGGTAEPTDPQASTTPADDTPGSTDDRPDSGTTPVAARPDESADPAGAPDRTVDPGTGPGTVPPAGDSADAGPPPDREELISQMRDFINRELAKINRDTFISDDEREQILERVDEAFEEQQEAEGVEFTHQNSGTARGPSSAPAAYDPEEEARENLMDATQQAALEALASGDPRAMAEAAMMLYQVNNDNSVSVDMSGADFSQDIGEDMGLLASVLRDSRPVNVTVPVLPDDGTRIRTMEARGVRIGENLPPAYLGSGADSEEIRALERRPRGISGVYKKEKGKKIGFGGKKKKKPLGLPTIATKAIKKKKMARAASASLFKQLMNTLRMQKARQNFKRSLASAADSRPTDGGASVLPAARSAELRRAGSGTAPRPISGLRQLAGPLPGLGAIVLTALGLGVALLLSRRRH